MSGERSENDKIFGYGEKVRIFIGGDVDEKEYHFTPVSLKNLEKLQKKLDAFFKAANKGAWNKEALRNAAEIIILCLDKVHKDVEVETILEEFSLGALAKAVHTVMDVNDFLSQMDKMAEVQRVTDQINKVQ